MLRAGLRDLFAGDDAIGFCAMCSDTNAAVRMTRIDADFDHMYFRYNCTHPNNSGQVIYKQVTIHSPAHK